MTIKNDTSYFDRIRHCPSLMTKRRSCSSTFSSFSSISKSKIKKIVRRFSRSSRLIIDLNHFFFATLLFTNQVFRKIANKRLQTDRQTQNGKKTIFFFFFFVQKFFFFSKFIDRIVDEILPPEFSLQSKIEEFFVTLCFETLTNFNSYCSDV